MTGGQWSANLIVVVDDDESVRKAVQALLRSARLNVLTFASAEEFLRSGQQALAACLIADIQMPGMTGIELHAKLVSDGHRIPVIFITSYGNPRLRDQARQLGAVQFFG